MPEPPRDRIRIGNLGPGDIALLKNIASEAAEQAVRKFAVTMGMDPDDPLGTQSDFGALRDVAGKMKDDAFHEDLRWLRTTRTRAQGIHGKAISAAVVVAVGGGLDALWTGLKALVSTAAVPGAH
jgi:hypothetical protein